MGINAAFSSWLRGAQSFATTTLRTAQGYGAALQQQTMTAVSAAQRAAVQPIQQVLQPRPSTRPTSSSPHTARTLTPVDAVSRAVSGGVQGVQEAARQIVRAHAPIVQGVQRDVGRVIQGAPAAARSAPAAVQQAARQISAAHAPIVQGVQRDVGRAVQGAPAAVRSAPVAVQQGVQQIARAHSSIAQGVRRDVGSVARSLRPSPQDIQEAKRIPFNAPAWAVAGAGVNLVRDVARHGVVLPGETDAQYRSYQAADKEYQKLRKQYGSNFEGDVFVARNAQDMAAYQRLQEAANKVDRTGKSYETSAQRELLGVPAALRGAGEWLSERDREISGAVLEYVPQLRAAPDVVRNVRYTTVLMMPGGFGMEVGGRLARRVTGKSAEEMPTSGEYYSEVARGMTEGVVYEPATTAAWSGVGMGIGGATGLAGRGLSAAGKAAGKAGRSSGLTKIVSKVGRATGLDRPARVVIDKAPDLLWKGVGVAYGADVGYRSIIDENGYIRPPLQQARELGRITATEALPMGAGAAAVSRAPALVRRAAAAPQRMVSSFRGRAASPAGMVGGPYPANWQIMDGLRMQALSPSSTIKTVRGSSRYPSSRVEMVDVGGGKRIPKGELDNYLRQFEVETPQWRKPVPEEYLAREDIAEAYKFGGRGVSLPGDPAPKAGWYPANWQILEGLRMREAAAPFQVARGGGSRYPKSRVEMVDVGGGKRIPKGELDNYLRRFEVESPAWRRPIPEEYLAREDIAEAYKFGSRGDPLLDRVPAEYRGKWDGGAPQAYYAGVPMGRSRQIHRQRFPSRKAPSSSSGRTPRIKPTTRTVPADLSSGQASPLMLGGWQDGALGEVAVPALSPAQVVSPITNSLSGQRSTSILDLGLGSSVLSRSGLDILGRQGVVSVQAQEQEQRQAALQVSDQIQSLLQTPRLRQKQKQKQKPRYARPRLPTAPKAKPRPRARARKSDDDEAERRRRLREAQEAAHWELGPAPGVEEMGMMIFGAGRRSVLNLGGSPLSFGFAARRPAPPVIPSFGPPSAGAPGKKPARAGENKKKGGRGAKKKK